MANETMKESNGTVQIDGVTYHENKVFNPTTRTDLPMIDPRAVYVEEGFNVRREFGDIEELKRQIREQGILNPISVVKMGKDEHNNQLYRLVDGHRRMTAVKEILAEDGNNEKLMRIRAILVPRNLSEQELCIQQMMRNEGKKFTEYECGLMFQRFRDQFGNSIADIARKFGKDASYVSRCLALLDLPQDIQQSIVDKEVTLSAVRSIVKENKDDEAMQSEVVRTMVETAKAKGKKTASLKDVSQEAKIVTELCRVRLSIQQLMEKFQALGEDSPLHENQSWLDNLDDALSCIRGVENEVKSTLYTPKVKTA